jgi:RNA polymerase sigma factor (sigma-70 family)
MFQLFRPNADTASDEVLLRRYRAEGAMHCLGILYERYIPMVYGVCLQILRDPGHAEDAVMAIYEELTVKVKNHEVTAFRGWLYVLARNHCLTEWRKARRQPAIDLHAPDVLLRYDTPTEEDADRWTLPEAGLDDCIGALSAEQRRCIELFYFADKSYREIADLLPEDLGKVRSHLQNGRRNLRNCLERTTSNPSNIDREHEYDPR